MRGVAARDRRIFRLAGGVGAVILAVVVAILLIAPMLRPAVTGPSSFAPASGATKVSPGAAGCPAVSGTVCFSVGVASRLHGLTLSNLMFRVMNLSNANETAGSLGPNATVSVLGPSESIVGLWGFSSQAWLDGSSWEVTFNTNVSFVLNTGLLSYSLLGGAWFVVGLTSPFEGEVDFPLYGPGTGNSA